MNFCSYRKKFYSVDHAVILFKAGQRMKCIICLMNKHVVELKVDLHNVLHVHCTLHIVVKIFSTLFSCI